MNLMYIIYQKYYNLKKTLMDDASSTYVKLCLIICNVFYLILLGSNIETNMVDVCECSMHFCGTFETDKAK